MADIEALESRLEPLLARQQPAEQRKLARDLTNELRRRQSARIAAQQNADGTPYQPRAKPRLAKGRSGPAKAERKRVQAMFAKLRTNRFLKASSDGQTATVHFASRVERIAAVHQWELFDRPEPNGPHIHYTSRALLGFAPSDRTCIVEHLEAALAEHDRLRPTLHQP